LAKAQLQNIMLSNHVGRPTNSRKHGSQNVSLRSRECVVCVVWEIWSRCFPAVDCASLISTIPTASLRTWSPPSSFHIRYTDQ